MKILVVLFLLVTSYQLLVTPVFADKEFSSSYDVSYDVDQGGVTTVTENIRLKNLTDKYFASNFSLTIDSTQLSEVAASDSQGNLETNVARVGTGTKIDVKFGQQVVGVGKEYAWSLKFKSKDFSEKIGKAWQVTVPKISSASDIDAYSLNLIVPVAFGDPTTISPEPKSQSESNGKLVLKYDKSQLQDTGILANFGRDQLFDFKLTYHLNNPNILPALAKLSLPSDSSYQQITLSDISPKPENVTVDEDGNYIGFFKIDKRGSLEITVSGQAKLNLRKNINSETLSKEEVTQYIEPQKYWETDNPIIKTKVEDILKEKGALTNSQKAKLINQFVVNLLSYSDKRLKGDDFQRFGALTALGNPDESLCSEFTDLFISLARAAGIPARQLVGYAYTSNAELRPLSLKGTVLHTWPEYYDAELGWVMIDPTWQNTTGGVDYFSRFDLNHLVLAVHGVSSDVPNTADDVEVEFSEGEFKPVYDQSLAIDTASEIFAGFPTKAQIMVSNSGNAALPGMKLSFSSSKLQIPGEHEFGLPVLPPFGEFEYSFDLRSSNILESYNDNLVLTAGDKSINKFILVKPFFSHRLFAPIVGGLFLLMVGVYGGVLALHYRRGSRARSVPETVGKDKNSGKKL